MQMDEGTQQNAALVEQAAAASQAIVEQVQALNGVVSRYHVDQSGSRAVSGAGAPKDERRDERSVERRSKTRPWTNPPRAAATTGSHAPARTSAAADDDAEWKEF